MIIIRNPQNSIVELRPTARKPKSEKLGTVPMILNAHWSGKTFKQVLHWLRRIHEGREDGTSKIMIGGVVHPGRIALTSRVQARSRAMGTPKPHNTLSFKAEFVATAHPPKRKSLLGGKFDDKQEAPNHKLESLEITKQGDPQKTALNHKP